MHPIVKAFLFFEIIMMCIGVPIGVAAGIKAAGPIDWTGYIMAWHHFFG
jgi:hypothetical protein